MRPSLLLLPLVAFLLACGGLGSPDPDVFAVGGTVRMGGADEDFEVLARYGRLAKIDLFGDAVWFDMTTLEPPGVPEPLDPADTCDHALGAKVAIAGEEGTVDEIHGRMMNVGTLWYPCTDGKAVVKPPPAPARPTPSPNSGRAAQISTCRSGCNRKCRGADNKAKCVGQCRRACAN